ncbi:hypothetical protein A0J50_06295 [Acinetobacter sp. DUT-2]|nr:hypothetical protein A0J50_06295 [Acinetobacter sp. DUT-2]
MNAFKNIYKNKELLFFSTIKNIHFFSIVLFKFTNEFQNNYGLITNKNYLIIFSFIYKTLILSVIYIKKTIQLIYKLIYKN